jgi:outer membrane lipoprotein-sorting protein
MRRLRTTSTQRLTAVLAAVVVLALTAALAQAALSGSNDTPDPKPLDRAVHDALTAPPVDGVSARVTFTNGLLPSGSLPDGAVSPIAAGAEGRLWLASGGRARLELQSEAGDAQIVADGDRLTVYDSASKTAYTMPTPGGDEKATRQDEPTLGDVRGALDRLAQTWTLSGAQPTNTAGRPTYTLRIAPKDDGGLLGAAELAWDALNGVPLRAAIYAQGQDAPVLELEADDVSYGPIDASTFDAKPPAGTRTVEIDPVTTDAHGKPVRVRGVEAVQKRLPFELSAPDKLAGLPRSDVRLVNAAGTPGALAIYGEGMGAIAVVQHEAGEQDGTGGLALPQVNIDGATGTELATPLGTLVRFQRGGVAYTVIGSVPPVAAENAARDL